MSIDPQHPIAPSRGAVGGDRLKHIAASRPGHMHSAEPFSNALHRALRTAKPTPAPASTAQTATASGVQNQTPAGVSSAVLLNLLNTIIASEDSMWNAPSSTLGLSGASTLASVTTPLSSLISPSASTSLSALVNSAIASSSGGGSTGLASALLGAATAAPAGGLPSLSTADALLALAGASGASQTAPTPTAAANGAAGQASPYAQAAGGPSSLRTALQPLIASLAPQYGLSSQLVDAMIAQESGYNAGATSSAGAMGLMQLMPSTAASLGVANPYDPVANLRGGMQYLSGLLKQFGGNVPLALAAYNAGPGAVKEYGGIPPYPQTQQYVTDIMSQLSNNPL